MRTTGAQCTMISRAHLASFALLALASTTAHAQGAAVIYVNVSHRADDIAANLAINPQNNILSDLRTVKSDALLLYTDYASRAGNELTNFHKNITGLVDDVLTNEGFGDDFNDSDTCWLNFKNQIKKIEHNARRAATYSGDSHHKFLLGYMIVFRMHLNKSEDYLKKCDTFIQRCGLPCETSPKVKRWRRLALEEIHRVQDDMKHTKKSYRDLVSHARRKLFHLRKHAFTKTQDAIEEYKICLRY